MWEGWQENDGGEGGMKKIGDPHLPFLFMFLIFNGGMWEGWQWNVQMWQVKWSCQFSCHACNRTC